MQRARQPLIFLSLVVLLAGATHVGGAPACADGLCLPGSEPQPARPYHVHLPLVVGGGSGSSGTPACDTAEVEPNDTHTAAQTLVSGCVVGSVSWRSDSWSSDLDWYRLNVCSGPLSLNVTLAGHGSADGPADLDLYLYGDPPGYPLYRSERPDSDEVISATNLLTGTYFVLVSPVEGQGTYTLEVQVRR